MSILLALQVAAAQGLLWGVMTLGAYISYKILDFPDLSVDGTYALGGAVCAVLIVNGWNPVLSMFVAMLAGMLGGLATALLHTKMKMTGLLAGILVMLGLYSINLRIMGKSNTSLLNANTINALLKRVIPASNEVLSIISGAVICALLIALLYWFFGTEVGCALRASGNNKNMARAMGVNTDQMVVLGLVLSNGLVGLSGALFAQYQGFADVGMGTGTMVMGLASIIIGEVIFRFMRRSFALRMLSAVFGTVVYRVIIGIVLQLGIMDANDMKLASAIIVVLVFALSMLLDKVRAAKGGQQNVKP
ncbi:ABC transporter permease [Ruminococcaceae bacterium OttesenSCG-928-A16]|nr:ABC transporter permease [Ruminococcaceae bacterium OttesenSCG-928-A16]